ncbi:hypothetical protein O181_007277 [Austropuccinia psidii MF-1]|uniref:Uncharacterized protein n=1 Tax=Austropuccinia psidii MF-1 TaxID=1389203 RepID=A0A9Q3GIB2_9BASI|nr:hypothetical protein [Austropuccinia psidii MF-1]
MVGCIGNSLTLLHTTFIRLYSLITSHSVRYWHTKNVPDIWEENYILLGNQSQANTPVTPSETEGSKGKGRRHREGLIAEKKRTPIATQRSRKPPNSAPIQVICHLYTSETLASKGTNQRTEKACQEPEDLEEDSLYTVVDGKTLRENIPTLPFPFQFNRNLKPEDWKDMDQVVQHYQLLKDLFQCSIENKRFNLPSHRARLGVSCQKVCLKVIDFRGLMVINQRLESHQSVQTAGGEGKQDKGESSHYPSYRRASDADRAYSDSFRLRRSRPNQLSCGFTPFRKQ